MNTLISVEEALERILAVIGPLEAETVPLLDGLQRVLAEDIVAESSVPPFDNSAMDGYAVHAADTAAAPATLTVAGELAAGDAPGDVQVLPGTAIRIMTGAPVPAGADAVVRFEQTSEADVNRPKHSEDRRESIVVLAAVRPGDNVRRAGEDIAHGSVVLRSGVLIRPQEIGVLAALGRGRVRVHRQPRVAILSTGNELVGVDEPVSPGKIRNVNESTTAALVRRYGGLPLCLGIAHDRIEDVRAKVKEGLAQHPDLFLTSAGVSVGDFDVVKDVLASEGHIDFWAVAMKPGKPMAFGRIRSVPLIGLPGNPVAAMVSFEQFVRPALLKMGGRRTWRKPTVSAVVQHDLENSGRRNYVRAVVERCGPTYRARAVAEQGSGVLMSMVQANGLMVVPEGVMHLRAGEYVEVQMLDWGEAYF